MNHCVKGEDNAVTDMEKVVKGIDICLNRFHCGAECPYYDNSGCQEQLRDDTLSLLKEQEAVEPSFKQDEKGIFVWCCGSCGAYMYHIYDGIDKAKEYAKFCRQCGKPVKWG